MASAAHRHQPDSTLFPSRVPLARHAQTDPPAERHPQVDGGKAATAAPPAIPFIIVPVPVRTALRGKANANALRLYEELRSHRGKDGYAYPTDEQLCADLGWSQPTLERARRQLRDRVPTWLHIHRERLANGRRGRNRYYLPASPEPPAAALWTPRRAHQPSRHQPSPVMAVYEELDLRTEEQEQGASASAVVLSSNEDGSSGHAGAADAPPAEARTLREEDTGTSRPTPAPWRGPSVMLALVQRTRRAEGIADRDALIARCAPEAARLQRDGCTADLVQAVDLVFARERRDHDMQQRTLWPVLVSSRPRPEPAPAPRSQRGGPAPRPPAPRPPQPGPPSTVETILEQRAAALEARYPTLYEACRHGAKYHDARAIYNPRAIDNDHRAALDLCRRWPDERLDKLACVVLSTADEWISHTDRGFKIFALKAAWADDKLTQREREQATLEATQRQRAEEVERAQARWIREAAAAEEARAAAAARAAATPVTNQPAAASASPPGQSISPPPAAILTAVKVQQRKRTEADAERQLAALTPDAHAALEERARADLREFRKVMPAEGFAAAVHRRMVLFIREGHT